VPRVVVHNAVLQCSCGSQVAPLQAVRNATLNLGGAWKPVASTLDHLPNANILPFGTCSQKAWASCSPATNAPWAPVGHNQVIIDGDPTLTEVDILNCDTGGVITVVDPGQSILSISGGK
jgi:hypothetical protein